MLQHYVALPPGAIDMGAGCGAHLQGNTTLGQHVRRNEFITEPATVRQILAHVGEPTTAPVIAPARSPLVEVNAQ